MRVRVWIAGAEGPSRDFELVEAPRVGERISVSVAGRIEEGVVTSVTWNLVAIERSGDFVLDDPVGSVALVHVICGPSTPEGSGVAQGQQAERAPWALPAASEAGAV
jgi:hypothetical protein